MRYRVEGMNSGRWFPLGIFDDLEIARLVASTSGFQLTFIGWEVWGRVER